MAEDGSLEFIGRVDQQVKMRGFRIELGEIESTLRSLPEVAEAAVVMRDQGVRGKQIVAYVVRTVGPLCNPAALRRKLTHRFPAHMLPDAIVAVEQLPLKASGKIDRDSLSKRPVEETGRNRWQVRKQVREKDCGDMERGVGPRQRWNS